MGQGSQLCVCSPLPSPCSVPPPADPMPPDRDQSLPLLPLLNSRRMMRATTRTMRRRTHPMSGSRFRPSCQVNLGRLIPRSGTAPGEGKAAGEGSGAGEEGKGTGWPRRAPWGPPHSRIWPHPTGYRQLSLMEHLLWASKALASILIGNSHSNRVSWAISSLFYR